MPRTTEFADALEPPRVPRPEPGSPTLAIDDDTLTADEKLLMIEGLFVHDATWPLPEGSGAPERIVAAHPGQVSQQRAHERLRTVLRWGIPAAAVAAVIIGRARPA